jgi:hypothetical protein
MRFKIRPPVSTIRKIVRGRRVKVKRFLTTCKRVRMISTVFVGLIPKRSLADYPRADAPLSFIKQRHAATAFFGVAPAPSSVAYLSDDYEELECNQLGNRQAQCPIEQRYSLKFSMHGVESRGVAGQIRAGAMLPLRPVRECGRNNWTHCNKGRPACKTTGMMQGRCHGGLTVRRRFIFSWRPKPK